MKISFKKILTTFSRDVLFNVNLVHRETGCVYFLEENKYVGRFYSKISFKIKKN